MIENIYVEDSISSNNNVKEIIKKTKAKNIIKCQSYKEVFNLKKQNFVLQKKNPSMILAQKKKNLVLKTPAKFNIGSKNNYYFSHMLNCIFDCEYCFLQGMYRSANYVVFTNYNSFKNEIKKISELHRNEAVHFFSGYDCDSLALENITNFAKVFIPYFKKIKNAYLELRTKSTNIKNILSLEPSDNIILAWSLSPNEISKNYENKTPSLKKKLEVIKKMQELGWKIGLRFDPLIYHNDFNKIYGDFFKTIFCELCSDKIHSITLGTLRLPKSFLSTIKNLGKASLFLEHKFEDSLYNYNKIDRNKMINFCYKQVVGKVEKRKIFFN